MDAGICRLKFVDYKQKKRNEKIKLEFIPRRLPLMNSSEK